MASVKSNSWRPLSVCVDRILRDVRVAKPMPEQGPAAAKLNRLQFVALGTCWVA